MPLHAYIFQKMSEYSNSVFCKASSVSLPISRGSMLEQTLRFPSQAKEPYHTQMRTQNIGHNSTARLLPTLSVVLQGQDFHRDVGGLADQLIPQHNYRLDAKVAEGRHYGEEACKEFWESVLRVMPHR